MARPKNLVIFASGSGSNTENIIKYFEFSDLARVISVFTNNPQAGVKDRCRKLGTPCYVHNQEDFKGGVVLQKLQKLSADMVILAGFLKKVPANILEAFPERVVNIHPALLPDYGGEGMYGKYVHQAVVENEEEETGITIHYVNEDYDEGEIIFQKTVELDFEDTWEDVDYKVRQLEYKHYPEVIEYLAKDL